MSGFDIKQNFTAKKIQHSFMHIFCTNVQSKEYHYICFLSPSSYLPSALFTETPDAVTVSAVDLGPMMEGRTYMLDCNIINVAPVQNLTVIWYRDNEKLSTETFNGTTVTPVNVSSSLRVTADRHHNGALFRCEAELHLGPELNLNTTSLSHPANVLCEFIIYLCIIVLFYL